MSESTAQKIDGEIRRLIDEAYAKAREILTEKNKDFVALAEGLLEYETLSGDEIRALLRGEKPARDLGDDTPPSRGSAVPKAGAKQGRQGRQEGRRARRRARAAAAIGGGTHLPFALFAGWTRPHFAAFSAHETGCYKL